MHTFVLLIRTLMARRRKKRNRTRTGIIVVLLVVAIAYVGDRITSPGAKGAEASSLSYSQKEKKPLIPEAEPFVAEAEPVNAETETTSAETSGEEAPTASAKHGKERAKGLEIPAYLTDRDEEIVIHEGFTLSYNKKHLVPNWVAWVLKPERNRGSLKRADNFQPDSSIVHGPIAQLSDYRRSGYDRGHMCPSADNKHSRDAMNQCFLLSNMCPQTHKLNAGDWEDLENLCRKWAAEYDSIYIVCGPIIEKGETYETIGDNKVTVPRQFYKVIMRWTGDNSAEAIGFIMNNDDTERPVASYAVTVDSVEARTGINFFSKFPKEVERKAEAKFDCAQWKNLVKNQPTQKKRTSRQQ